MYKPYIQKCVYLQYLLISSLVNIIIDLVLLQMASLA